MFLDWFIKVSKAGIGILANEKLEITRIINAAVIRILDKLNARIARTEALAARSIALLPVLALWAFHKQVLDTGIASLSAKLRRSFIGRITRAITEPLCVACSVTDVDNVLTPAFDDFAVVTANVGALDALPVGSNIGIDVAYPQLRTANNNPGFIVSFPDADLLALGVAPDLTVSTVPGGEVLESASYGFGFFDTIALDTPLQDINNAHVIIGVAATQDYDGIRFKLTNLVANALLSIDVFGACGDGIKGSISGDF